MTIKKSPTRPQVATNPFPNTRKPTLNPITNPIRVPPKPVKPPLGPITNPIRVPPKDGFVSPKVTVNPLPNKKVSEKKVTHPLNPMPVPKKKKVTHPVNPMPVAKKKA